MKSIKKTLVGFTLTIAFFMVGCGSMDIGTSTKLDEKGKGKITIKTCYEGIFNNVINMNEPKSIYTPYYAEGKNIKQNTYKEGNKTIQEENVRFENLGEFNKLFKNAYKNGKISHNIKERKGFFKNKYDYTITIPNNISLKELTKQVNEDDLKEAGMNKKEFEKFLGEAIKFKFKIEVPGKVLKNNATKVKSNVITWEYNLKDMDSKQKLQANYVIINFKNIFILCGFIAILMLIIGFFKYKKNKMLNEDTKNHIRHNINNIKNEEYKETDLQDTIQDIIFEEDLSFEDNKINKKDVFSPKESLIFEDDNLKIEKVNKSR